MATSINIFKREFLKSLEEDNAAIFAGAGLSVSNGYADWKGLLTEIAEEIGLDVHQEDDLVSLAQYYYNEKGQNRTAITRKIIESFTKETKNNKNLEIITSLPIGTYWTTNYDRLLEEGLNTNLRKPDVKITEANLAQNLPGRDAVVYKMHGDIGTPENAVILKDDYEAYNFNRKLFSTNLQGDLISKTFLFIGFSFEDPNLNYILSRIRVLLGTNKRDHYCFFRRIQRKSYDEKDEAKFQYDKIKQELKIKDLQRYSINAVLVDEYSEITTILSDIEQKYRLNNIFISGSASEFGDFKEVEAQKFIFTLSKRLIEEDLKITSGFGKNIGDSIINGALTSLYENKYKKTNDFLVLKPFPQNIEENQREELWNLYRRDIISNVGIVIFIFGNRINQEKPDEIEIAPGVLKEFEIAKEMNKFIIPIAATGFAAEIIFEEIKENIASYSYLEDSLEILKSETNVEKLITEINKIKKRIERGLNG